MQKIGKSGGRRCGKCRFLVDFRGLEAVGPRGSKMGLFRGLEEVTWSRKDESMYRIGLVYCISGRFDVNGRGKRTDEERSRAERRREEKSRMVCVGQRVGKGLTRSGVGRSGEERRRAEWCVWARKREKCGKYRSMYRIRLV